MKRVSFPLILVLLCSVANAQKPAANTLRLGLPKGSLQEATLALFRKAGFNFGLSSRSYNVASDDPDISALLIRVKSGSFSRISIALSGRMISIVIYGMAATSSSRKRSRCP